MKGSDFVPSSSDEPIDRRLERRHVGIGEGSVAGRRKMVLRSWCRDKHLRGRYRFEKKEK